jgi:DNA-directed RNA polymerase subunit RPC12/RpoP
MTIHTGRLVLTPADPFYLPRDIQSIVARLRSIQFCEEPISSMNGQHYLLGERFMQLVSFMGCSPFIQVQPADDEQPFCHLSIDGPYPKPVFLQGRNTTSPSCEDCRKRITDWPPLIAQWLEQPETFLASCPHCGHRQNPASYNWRQSAGCGRLFLFVENIFPNEAIPSPELLETLEESGPETTAWGYFYIQD